MADYLKGKINRHILSVLIALTAIILIAGAGYAFSPTYILQIGGGDGFLSDVDPDAGEDAPLRVIDFQVGKTDIASDTEIEVEAIVANYGSEEKENVVIEPVLTSMDGSTDVSDDMDVRPKERYEIESFKSGSIRTFRYYIEFNHDPSDSGQQELTYKLKLTDKDGNREIENIKQSERVINILPKGSSTAGSRFIDRDPFSISTFPVDKYKDKFVDERDVIGADRSIPPINKDENDDISEVDVAEGEVTSYGALTQTDTRNSGEISAANGEMRIGFGFESIPTREHYVLRIAHEDENIEEEVELDIVDRRGNEIDKNSTYMLSASERGIKQFDYHLTEKEVDHITGQGDLYVVAETTNDGATNDVDIDNAYYLSLLGVNTVADLPESDLNVTSIEPVDGNYQIVNGRPTYDIDEKMKIQVEITNEGDGSYSGDLGLNELDQGFTSARSVNRSTIINPNQTRVYNFETEATRPGTHNYVVKDESTCASNIECPLQLQVRESSDDIVPRVTTESPNVIAEETSRFELDGVFSSDYDNIDSIDWEFEQDERSFNDASNGVVVDHTFTDKGRKTVSAEVEYTLDGQTRTAEHSIFVDVIERPSPSINAIYYDVKAADRGGTRTGEPYGPGITGTLVSDSCEGQCGGEMSIAGISPQMTDGLSMMVIDKKFGSDEDSDVVHYGTYDFEANQYAKNDGTEFSGSLQDELEPGAIPSFTDDISDHSGEGKIFIFVGGGDPSIPIDVESELESMGAEFGGYGSVGDNVSYTFIAESQGSGDYKPMHESYLPPSSGEPLRHSIGIVPVEASGSDVPQGQEVYFDVTDEKGSNYYDELDNDQISYNWGGAVDSRGEYSYIVPSSSISTSVSLGLETISDADQQSSITVPVDDKEANIQARAMQDVIQKDGKAVFTAAHSYDSDNQIDPTKLDWSISSPSGTSVIQNNVNSKQSISLIGGETPGRIEATLLYEGEEVDTAEVQLITDAEARFEFNRVPGLIDHDRGTVSDSETPIYNYGQTDNSNSLSRLDLSSVTEDVPSVFGNGFVIFNDNSVELRADATSGTSASRFVQTNDIDFGRYDSLYVSYQRTVISESNSPDGEVGYVSAHTGEITQDEFMYGEKGTLRGSDTDIPMTSDVVTSEQSNTRYGVMELDVSGVSTTESVTVHARANAENNAITSVNIYEVWAGGRDSMAPISQMFDSNIYPSELSENVQYISSRKGLGFKSLGGANGNIQSRSFNSGFLEARYGIPSEGSDAFSIITGGVDVASRMNSDSVRTDSAGNSVLITGDSSDQPVITDSVVTEVESSNTNNPIVVLDARNSAALPEDDYSWSASDSSAVDIENPESIRTVAEFTDTGEHDITLSVDSRFGSSTKTKTVQVDSTAPDISLEMPSNAEVGETVPINVDNSADSDVQETVVMHGNGEKSVIDGSDATSYTYSNPGTYQVTVVSRDSNGLTSSDSKEIKIGTLGVQVVDSLSESVFLPNNAYFDATGTASVPEDAQPAELIDVSNLIQNEDEMSYTWEAPDGSTSEGSTYIHPVNSEGTDNLNLIVEGPSGSTETMEIELQKDVAIPTIQALSVTRNSIQTFEPFNVQYSVNQPSGVDAQVEVDLNDGSENVTGTITGSSNSELPSSINTENRIPGDLPDTYNVELFVENQYSETDYQTTEIEVEEGPKADFQFIGNEPFSVGTSVSMDASESVDPYDQELQYTWSFTTTDVVASSSLLNRYTFDNTDTTTVVDVIGSNGATIQNGESRGNGIQGDALNADGNHPAITSNDAIDGSASESMTYASHIYYEGANGDDRQMLFNQEHELELAVKAGELKYAYSEAYDGDSWNSGWQSTGYDVPVDEWTHTAITYNSSSDLVVYADGEEVARDSVSGNQLNDDNYPLYIGHRGTENDNVFGGRIDEVRLYDKALSQSQIQEIALGSAGTTETEVTNVDDPTLTRAFERIGDREIELTVTDANGDSDTVRRSVEIDSSPVAGLSASSVQRTGDIHEFEFDAGSSSVGGLNNGIQTYRFDFDNDGSYDQTSNNPVVTHSYEESGEFTTVVQVEDAYGSTATAGTTVTSDPRPPRSCRELQDNGIENSGNYLIHPEDQPIEVYCEMDYDGGGWTRMNVSTAKQFVDTFGGGINVISQPTHYGYDGDRPYTYDYPQHNDPNFIQYNIETGFGFSEMAVEDMTFTSMTQNSDTSETRHTGSYMGSWADNANSGNIVWGSTDKSVAEGGYEDSDGINCTSCTETWDPSKNSKKYYDLGTEVNTVSIGMGETGYQAEGWRWEEGRIYVR